jgi:hypothetical protein
MIRKNVHACCEEKKKKGVVVSVSKLTIVLDRENTKLTSLEEP